MLEKRILVTHLVGLSELESISIDDGVGARDKWRREDNFPLREPATLRMRLVCGLLLDMMIVRREGRSEALYEFARCLFFPRTLQCKFYIYAADSTMQPGHYGEGSLTSARRGPYSSLCYMKYQDFTHPSRILGTPHLNSHNVPIEPTKSIHPRPKRSR